MTINLKQLIADREAGTDGPWFPGYKSPGALSVYIRDKSGKEVAEARGGNVRVNSDRIARLPDLEAAFLEAVELLQRISETDSSQLPIGQAAVKIFLEKLK